MRQGFSLRVYTAILGVGLVLVFIGYQPSAFAQQSQTDFASEVLALLNTWRVEQGLWPLKVNDTLQQMALAQAEYVLSLSDVPDGSNLHFGRSGETPSQRAAAAPYNWPTYGTPEEIAIGEIAAVGNPRFALNFWKNSAIHARTALNPAYREVGIAALPHGTDYLFIVVLGGRPNVLPAFAEGDQLYLSNERAEGGTGDGDWIQAVTQVRLFDAEGKPITDNWLEWQPRLTIPTTANERLFVLYSDGTYQVLTEVTLNRTVPPLIAQVSTPVPVPTATAVPPTPTPIPQVNTVPETPPAEPDVLILYDTNTLTLLNVSPDSLDLSAFDMEGSGISIPFTRWTQVTDLALNDFPSGHCLQVKGTGQDGEITMPPGCRWLRSIITLAPAQFFWLGADFEVRQNGQVVATCEPGRPECRVKLPG